MNTERLGGVVGIAVLVVLAGSFLVTAQLLLSVLVTAAVVTTGVVGYLLWRYVADTSGGDGGSLRA
jgi:hypothetical protein